MTLYDDVESRLKDNAAKACLVSKMQETQSRTGLNRTEMSYIAGSLFAAGTDVRVIHLGLVTCKLILVLLRLLLLPF